MTWLGLILVMFRQIFPNIYFTTSSTTTTTTSTTSSSSVSSSTLGVLTTRGDDMAWLDPGHVPTDFSYNVLRAALLAVLRHNTNSKSVSISSVLCPDFITVC